MKCELGNQRQGHNEGVLWNSPKCCWRSLRTTLSISAVMTFWIWTGWLVFKNLRAWSVHAPAAAGSRVGGKVMGQQGALDSWASVASTQGDGEQAGPRGRSPFPFFFLRFSEFGTILFLFYVLVFWLGDMWDLSSSTRDQACTRWFGRQSLNPWAARGVYFL